MTRVQMHLDGRRGDTPFNEPLRRPFVSATSLSFASRNSTAFDLSTGPGSDGSDPNATLRDTGAADRALRSSLVHGG